MKSKLPTILIMAVMVLIGAMYWVDMAYYTNPATGFVTRGPMWLRFVVLALPLVMVLLGLRTVGPRAISVLRTRNPVLAGVFAGAGALGAIYGIVRLTASLLSFSGYGLVLGLMFVWYGVWMVLAALQLFSQRSPSPTNSALLGVLAAVPFCVISVFRILVQPSALSRVGPLVYAFSALLAMLWFGLLLRSLYIALPRGRVRWTYLIGAFAFLFCTCLELPLAIYSAMFTGGGGLQVMESIAMAGFGIAAGCTSVAIAGASRAKPAEDENAPAQPGR